MTAEKIEFGGHLAALELKPGDRFVLTCPQPLGKQAGERIRAMWRDFAGDAPLLILDGDLKLGVIRAAEEGGSA